MYCAKFLEGKQIMIVERMRAYPPKIIQSSSLGRLQKKSMEDSDCLYVAS